MNKWLWLALGALLLLFLLRVAGVYLDCLISHRSGYYLKDDREPIHQACKLRLSPFYI